MYDRQSSVLKGVLMTNKELFCSFYVSFCTFCTSLRLTRTVFSRLLKKAVSMALCTKASLCVKSSLLEQSLPRTPSRPKTSVPSVAKNPLNPCNPCLINDLRSTKTYVRKNKLFMRNKAKFQKVKFNVTKVLTRDYEHMDTWSIRKKQSQTKPNSKRPK